MSQTQLQEIYLSKVSEGLERLKACESFLRIYQDSQSVFAFEAAVLQMRKAFECVAYAAIAPNKKEYAEFRAKTDKQPDYTKDFHASKIMKLLSKINPHSMRGQTLLYCFRQPRWEAGDRVDRPIRAW